MGTDVDAAREAFGMTPPGRPIGEGEGPVSPGGAAGPTSPGTPEPESNGGPESGGYDNRPPAPQSDNRKGGYGAG